ncbi:penicillin-binding transpeptidase domain-containing protein [Streptomyces sp. NPDC002506]|uniref:peptidoglycan D,D-transpeptidase FtsI family protein n=1 Tax=Streptomyces sp. NPDC002506 TaxID=3154536 RepID=UPI003332C952
MNRPLRHIAVFCGLLVLSLLVRTTWIQFVEADALANHEDNRRVKIAAFANPRGNIIVGGSPITGSQESSGDFKYKRTFTDGAMYAPITGYASQLIGTSLLEHNYDKVLSGRDDRLALDRAKSVLTGEKPRGGDVITTIDPKAQEAAYKGLTALKNAKGAVVAIDPRSGSILAMASTPSYDPSVFAGLSDGAKFKALDTDANKPLSNRALRETYPPGSTFKILTAAAALETGAVTDIDASSGAVSPYPLPLSTTKISSDPGDAACDKVSMKRAMEISCNNVFLNAADKVGRDKMREIAEKFGLNSTFYDKGFGDLAAAKSLYPDKLDRPQTAMTGMGQGSLTSTPLQMAVVTAALANDGKVMQPHVVDEVRGPDLSTIEKNRPKQLSRAVSGATAKKVQDMMEATATVDDGSARKARIDGFTVGGKTGTAQHGADVHEERPYAWFVSYAKQSDGTSPVAVAVFVDPKDMTDISRTQISGGKLGAPIAKAVMEAVLKK